MRRASSTALSETAGGRSSSKLREYRKKRDFSVTPEPSGAARVRGAGNSFVVQKHAATRLHYDFRLELDGVLLSWAVPKGPSLDPGEKRLAMRTEDHPVDYGTFEGVIPEGEYGGGTVLLWDRGTWEPLGDPHTGLAKGKLEFVLHGKKLRGRWTLVKIRGRAMRDAEKAWLLIKGRDETARPSTDYEITAALPKSVATDRTLDQIASERDRVWHSNKPASTASSGRRPAVPQASRRIDPGSIPGARRAALPAFIAPELATLVAAAPAGDEWLHEMKFDGYRVLCRIERGAARLLSRNGKDWTGRLPGIARAVSRLPVDAAMIDGEAAVVLPNGVTSFNALQNALGGGGAAEPVYFAFDLLHLDGRDLTRSPLEERKAALRALIDASSADQTLRYSDHVTGNGAAFLRQACRMSLEGVVSKRGDSPYKSGRGRDWLKAKCIQEQEFVIGGFTDPEGRRTGIGALLLGVCDAGGELVYVGKVGTGFSTRDAVELRRRLDRLEQTAPPFAKRPPGSARAHWVRPELVGEVEFTEWTPDGRLRHPSWKGLREDKDARVIVHERPADATPRPRPGASAKRSFVRARTRRSRRAASGDSMQVAGVRITHPDRVLYAPQGITKLDLARFYESIAEWILPHLRGRPTSLVRCPEGLSKECFYQKHVGVWAPAALRRVRIQEKKKVGEYLVVEDLPGLIGLVQIGILEIHTWNAVAERLEQPDRLVFDLDPGDDVPWRDVVAAARTLRERLQQLGLVTFLKTTGGKGLHLVVPIDPGPSWTDCLAFARAVAGDLARESPGAFTVDVAKRERHGRIYLDYLRNLRGATAVAAYSTRARPGAPVSTPLAWDELGPRLRADHFTVSNLPRRLTTLRHDPWKDYARTRQALPARRR
ncbi:MAG TPA: DNA ligase D [Candidatus Binatia bacterium]|nr:DNA ligase D [Candidatus Binatia bacterium]